MAQEILIVDDDPDLVTVVSIVLKAEGYEVISPATGRQERILQAHPDLILLDVMMDASDRRIRPRLRTAGRSGRGTSPSSC